MNYMDENEINTKAQISKFSTIKQEMRGAFLKKFRNRDCFYYLTMTNRTNIDADK